ncbi:MAG: hypothetical protein U0Y10_16015 [Spirosomataceae bacterium]
MKSSAIAILLFISTVCFGQFAGKGGVNFVKGNLRTPFDLAKSQNKKVFIEVFSPTCHVCQSFIPIFDSPAVGSVYNQNFVSFKADINSQETIAFLLKQKIYITSIPLLLYFDKDVNLQHIGIMGEGMNQNSIVLNTATAALDPKQNAAGCGARYKAGLRDPGFLIDYGYYSRIQCDTNTVIKVMNDYAKTQSKTDMSNATNFMILQKIILDADNGLFTTMMGNLNQFYAKYPKQQVNTTAESIIMATLYSSRARTFSIAKIAALRGYMSKLGIDAKSVENRTLMPELNILFAQRQAQAGLERIKQYIKVAAPGPKEYEFLCNFVRSKTQDPIILNQITDWCKKGGVKP